MQAALAWWNTVSPFSPYGPTIALVFVLLVAAGKAIIEDKKRHKEDRITNNSTAMLCRVTVDCPCCPPLHLQHVPGTCSRQCSALVTVLVMVAGMSR